MKSAKAKATLRFENVKKLESSESKPFQKSCARFVLLLFVISVLPREPARIWRFTRLSGRSIILCTSTRKPGVHKLTKKTSF